VRCNRAKNTLIAPPQEQTEWDEQMDEDSAAGRLDFLFDDACKEGEEGLVGEWPPVG
jgi:hypothetical protein